MKRRFATVCEATEALARGQVIIVLDSEDRENEGDFLTAAAGIDPRTIDFMCREGRGQLCMPILPDVADRLQLVSMVASAGDIRLPRFALPIDHKSCHTGISPLDRAVSIHAIVDPESRPEDFVRPGHIFTLIARPGGVLERMGHTEATVDLMRLAGLAPAGVLCEVCSRDGLHMATRDELFDIADEFGLLMTTIDALIDVRRQEAAEESAVLDVVQQLRDELSLARDADSSFDMSVPAVTGRAASYSS